jgi:hypothetical protein
MIILMRRLLEDRWLVFVCLGVFALFASSAVDMRIAAIAGLATGASVWLGLGFDLFWHWHERHPGRWIVASAFLMTTLFGGEALYLTSAQLVPQAAQALGVGIITLTTLLLTGAQILGGKTPRAPDEDHESHNSFVPYLSRETAWRL